MLKGMQVESACDKTWTLHERMAAEVHGESCWPQVRSDWRGSPPGSPPRSLLGVFASLLSPPHRVAVEDVGVHRVMPSDVRLIITQGRVKRRGGDSGHGEIGVDPSECDPDGEVRHRIGRSVFHKSCRLIISSHMSGQLSPTEAAEAFLLAITSQQQSPASTSSQPGQPGEADNFDTAALHGLQVLSCEWGTVLCSFPVTRPKTNRYRTLHGGCMGESEMWRSFFWALNSHLPHYCCQLSPHFCCLLSIQLRWWIRCPPLLSSPCPI